MKHTECKDCELSNGNCGYHFKMDGITNYDIASLSACDKYGNCNFFKPKTQLRADLIYHGNPMEWGKIMENSSWIPIKTKKLSPEEIREFCEETHEFSPEEMDGAWRYDCKLPEKTQDVLITTRFEDVVITKFVCDGCEGYFEDFEDEGDLLAWMPLPEPYKKEENE